VSWTGSWPLLLAASTAPQRQGPQHRVAVAGAGCPPRREAQRTRPRAMSWSSTW